MQAETGITDVDMSIPYGLKKCFCVYTSNSRYLQARDRIESMAALDETARSWRRADKQLSEQWGKAAGRGARKGTRRLLQVRLSASRNYGSLL